jgi:hypothetical protein
MVNVVKQLRFIIFNITKARFCIFVNCMIVNIPVKAKCMHIVLLQPSIYLLIPNADLSMYVLIVHSY